MVRRENTRPSSGRDYAPGSDQQQWQCEVSVMKDTLMNTISSVAALLWLYFYLLSQVPRSDATRLLEIVRLVQQTLQFGNPIFQVRNMPFLVSAKNVHELDLCLQRHLF